MLLTFKNAHLSIPVAGWPNGPRLQEGGSHHVARQVVGPAPRARHQIEQVHLIGREDATPFHEASLDCIVYLPLLFPARCLCDKARPFPVLRRRTLTISRV